MTVRVRPGLVCLRGSPFGVPFRGVWASEFAVEVNFGRKTVYCWGMLTRRVALGLPAAMALTSTVASDAAEPVGLLSCFLEDRLPADYRVASGPMRVEYDINTPAVSLGP